MTIFPLLVCIYLVSNYVFPQLGFRLEILNIIIIVLITSFIALLGFLIVRDVFTYIMSVSKEAQLIAAGDLTRRIEISRTDELGDLSDALNKITDRIRSNMDELRSYSEKTAEINLEIQKRVIVLSSLLQISALISQSARLEDILKLTVEKTKFLAKSDIAYLFFREEGQEDFNMKVMEGIDCQHLLKIKVEPQDSVFGKLIKANKTLILDKENILPANINALFYEKFKLKNMLAQPIYLRGRVMGILGIGNSREPFIYKKDDLELLDIFAKQLGIAIENDRLMYRVEKLEIKDALTGLYNESFIRRRLEEEIRRAITYQRPCGLILLDVDNFATFQKNFGSLQAEATLKKIATILKDSVSEIDRVARTGGNEFVIVLPEKNKRHAKDIAETIRKRIEFSFSEEPDIHKRLTVSGGVSENPLDGVEVDELINKAKGLLKLAKKEGKNRIAV
jgi:diguanylate cyclase (GGDEF)-like protein